MIVNQIYFQIIIHNLFSQHVRQVVCSNASSFSKCRTRSHCFNHLPCNVSYKCLAPFYLVISLSCLPKSDAYIEQTRDLSMQYRSNFSIYINVIPFLFRLIKS